LKIDVTVAVEQASADLACACRAQSRIKALWGRMPSGARLSTAPVEATRRGFKRACSTSSPFSPHLCVHRSATFVLLIRALVRFIDSHRHVRKRRMDYVAKRQFGRENGPGSIEIAKDNFYFVLFHNC
jgi:hypothetical protein